MLLQVAFGPDDALGCLLRLTNRLVQCLDFLVDILHRGGALVEAREPPSKVVDFPHRAGGSLLDLLERFMRLRELRGSTRHLRDHLTQRAAFLPRRIDERLELVVGGFLRLLRARTDSECVQHVVLPKLVNLAQVVCPLGCTY